MYQSDFIFTEFIKPPINVTTGNKPLPYTLTGSNSKGVHVLSRSAYHSQLNNFLFHTEPIPFTMPPTTLPITTEPAIIPCIYAACKTPAIFGGRESAGCSFGELFQQFLNWSGKPDRVATFELTNISRHDFGVWEVEWWNGWTEVKHSDMIFNATQKLRFRPTQPWFGIVSIPFLIKGKLRT